MTEKILYDDTGNLDDVALSDVSMFRLEYMDEGTVWRRLDRDNAKDVVIWLCARTGKITGKHDFD